MLRSKLLPAPLQIQKSLALILNNPFIAAYGAIQNESRRQKNAKCKKVKTMKCRIQGPQH